MDEVHKINNQPKSYPNLLPSIVSSCAYRVVKVGSKTASHDPSLTTLVSSSKLEKVSKAFDGLGRGLTTEDVFQRLVREPPRKMEKAVAEIWLDGQTVGLHNPSKQWIFIDFCSLLAQLLLHSLPRLSFSHTLSPLVLSHFTERDPLLAFSLSLKISPFGSGSPPGKKP